MLDASISEVLLRSIPQHVLSGVQSGEFGVHGSIIRDLASGRIVAHLQETSGFSNIAGSLLTASANLPLQGADLALGAVGHTVSYVQNKQILAGVSLLQSMQLANLALSAAAIGVSVAGFALLARKLAEVETKIGGMERTLNRLSETMDDLRRDRIIEDLVRLRTAMEQLEEGWLLQDPVSQWRLVAGESHHMANRFERRASELLERTPADLSAADPLIEAFALAANTRITARMAANEGAAALQAARESAIGLMGVGDGIQLTKAALAATPPPERPGAIWLQDVEKQANIHRPFVQRARDREGAAAATCLTLDELQRRRISSRLWLEKAREEQEAPLLCLLPRG